MESTFVIKARGLPWSATANEVVKFFGDVNIISGENGVHFTFNKEGRPSGECFIEVSSEHERDIALAHNNEHMGKRYIEIKEAKHSEMEWVVNKMSSGDVAHNSDNIVRLRGLPYGCSRQDIDIFFSGLQIIPYGITITMDQDGRASGDAYVEFATNQDVEAAMKKHKEKMGHRYIEVFRSSKGDIKHVVGAPRDFNKPFMSQRPGPYDRPNFSSARRGRGGIGLGPSGFNSGSNYDNGRMGRGGRGGPMRGGRGGGRISSGGTGIGGGNMQQASKTGHCVHMRGLPFDATTNDVIQFFAPLNPVDIRFIYDQNTGRVKGECDVDFATHIDAEAAMQKDKQNMAHRYIELFLQSNPVGNVGGPPMGGSGWSHNTNDMNNVGRNDIAPLMGSNTMNRPPPNQQISGGGQSFGPNTSYSASSYGGGYSNTGYTNTTPASNMAPGYGAQNNYNTGANNFGQQQQVSSSYDNYNRGTNNPGGYTGGIQSGGTGNNYYGNMR